LGLSDSLGYLTLAEGTQSSVQRENAMIIIAILTSEFCGIRTPKPQDCQFQSPAVDMVQSHFRVPTAVTVILRKVNLLATLSCSPLIIAIFPWNFSVHTSPPIVAAVIMLQCNKYALITQWCVICRSWDGAVSAVTKPWTGRLRKCGSICDRAWDFFLLQSVRTDTGTHGTSYLIIICSCELDGAWSWPLISILCRVQAGVGLYLDSSMRFRGMRRDICI
jgi:hypothetical protein